MQRLLMSFSLFFFLTLFFYLAYDTVDYFYTVLYDVEELGVVVLKTGYMIIGFIGSLFSLKLIIEKKEQL